MQLNILQIEAAEFGIDWDGPLPTEFFNGEEEGVEIPPVNVPISEEQFYQLETQVNPNEPSRNYGIELYLRTIEFLAQMTHQ